MQLNEAVSKRLIELLDEYDMTQYQLYKKSGVPKSTINNLVSCTYSPNTPTCEYASECYFYKFFSLLFQSSYLSLL